MNVIYDLLGFQSRDHGERGIARYVLQLALALEKNHPGLVTQYLMHPDLPFPTGAETLIATGRVARADREDVTRSPSASGVFLAGSLFEMDEPLDRVLPRWTRTPTWRTMTVLYDLIPAKFADWYLQRDDIRHRYEARMWAMAGFDRLLAISQASADDAVEILGYRADRITVIGAGADERFRPPIGDHASEAQQLVQSGEVPGLRASYVLFPSGIERRKNIERTVEAFASLPPAMRADYQLVLVCGLDDNGRHHLAHLASEFGLGDDEFLATGFVSDANLCRLYQGAELVVFPSIYEGFGLPVLEGMQCRAPVICSDSSSLKEIQDDARARFDPSSTSSIAQAIESALGDPAFRDELRHAPVPPFTWDLAAELTAGEIRGLQTSLSESGLSVGPGRPRLALVSPLPPQQSGIANYAYQLLAELSQYAHITVFVDGIDPALVEAPPGVEVENLSRLDLISRGGGAFDRTLYFMGNSSFHVEMLEVMRTNPGWVLMHDIRLTGLYAEVKRLAPKRMVDASVGATLAELYPGRYRPAVEAMEVIPPDQANRFGIHMTREVAALADHLLVHSDFGADLLRLDADVEATVVYPHPCPTVGPIWQPGVSSAPVVSSFGIVAPPKHPDVLIAALPLIHEAIPDVRVRLVGAVGDDYRAELLRQAVDLGVDGHIEFAGHLDARGFAMAQLDTTVAVQLRSASNGESSGAVSELLAKGVPTVVTDLGPMSELPADAVAKVPFGAGPEAVAAVLIELLSDTAECQALSSGALDYARTNTYARAAVTLAKTLFP